ncbi:HD domain-containing protein [Streptomyces sp. NPDC058947]|uniref:HD domain-containing protein n=1 Tax=Streptomyces sp. NPDC058947 TaxID=3346675 RepID=UPI00367F09C8
MKVYEVLIRVEADDEVNEAQVREEIYDACPDVNFGFDIESISPKVTSLAEVDRFAEQAHEGQVDKGGVPYIEHVRAVSAGLEPFSTRLQMAGLLHDVIEDTEWTAEGLRQAGIESRVVRIVELVTKTPGESYMDRIRKISEDREATLLKIADNAHNSRADRAAMLPDGNRGRLERYRKAREILWATVKPEEIESILAIVNPDLLAEHRQFTGWL